MNVNVEEPWRVMAVRRCPICINSKAVASRKPFDQLYFLPNWGYWKLECAFKFRLQTSTKCWMAQWHNSEMFPRLPGVRGEYSASHPAQWSDYEASHVLSVQCLPCSHVIPT